MMQQDTKQIANNFTLDQALTFKDGEAFAVWLDKFLRGPGGNVPLADGLQLQRRWWLKPELRSLDSLVLKCGPGKEFHEDERAWNSRIKELAGKIKNGLVVPPLVAEFKGNQLVLADGAHRCGALQLLGESTYWTAIWFNSKDDYDRFLETDKKRIAP